MLAILSIHQAAIPGGPIPPEAQTVSEVAEPAWDRCRPILVDDLPDVCLADDVVHLICWDIFSCVSICLRSRPIRYFSETTFGSASQIHINTLRYIPG